ncbi:MAG: peptidylprolyl isomerase [Runella slithyformis]|nr:MAG: peptidylprolyl isomerase [Runella slithyformis]
MAVAKAGDTVLVHYTGTLTDGTLFDSSVGRDPLQFRLGTGMVIKGFDDGVSGMAIGDKKRVEIPIEEAYGPVQDDMIFTFNRAEVPADIPLELGLQLNMHGDGGHELAVTVIAFNDETLTLDGNHPLAGQALVFDLELVAIQ